MVYMINCFLIECRNVKYFYAKNEPLPLPLTIKKINSKWITYLNIKGEIIKLLKENTGEKAL